MRYFYVLCYDNYNYAVIIYKVGSMRHYIIILLLLLSLIGCSKQPRSSLASRGVAYTVPSISMLQLFKAKISGVECTSCAQEVEDICNAIEAVQHATFLCCNNDFERGYIEFLYDNSAHNFNLVDLDNRLAKEGFILESICGVFRIEPRMYNNELHVAFNKDYLIPILCETSSVAHDLPAISYITGNIARDKSQGSFYMQLMHDDTL